MAANFTTFRAEVQKTKAVLKQLDTALSAVGATSVSPGTTADDGGTQDARMRVITATIQTLIKEVADISADIVS